jgi:hypothetical protein
MAGLNSSPAIAPHGTTYAAFGSTLLRVAGQQRTHRRKLLVVPHPLGACPFYFFVSPHSSSLTKVTING